MDVVDVKNHVPAMIRSTKKRDGTYREFPATLIEESDAYRVEYETPVSNQFAKDCGTKTISRTLPKSISKSVRTYEILGFLQGEMSKTHRGPLTFCNSELSLMRKSLEWFEEEFDVAICGRGV